MTRRSWLGSLMALAGLQAASGNQTAPLKPLPAGGPFPYPTYSVRGADAFATWQRLRSEGAGYPLIVGDPENASLVAELPELNGGTTESVLAAAREVDFPKAILEAHAAELKEAAAEFGEAYSEDYRVGDWPQQIPVQAGPEIVRDLLTREYHREVLIVVLPTSQPDEAIAMLRYGGWNACPGPEVHAAAFRDWGLRFGFEPVCVGHDVIEGRVTRRPSDRVAALALAREHHAYCPDTVDQGTDTLAALAAILMASDWWFFWWD